MSTTLPPSPYALPGCAVALTSQTVYNATIPYWINPGIPVIVGLSPQQISALTGAPVVLNPNYAQQQHFPYVSVFPQTIEGTSVPPPLNVGSGMVGGLNWAWQCYVGLNVLPANNPVFQVQVGVYQGNSSNRSFNVGFQPIAVWIKPLQGGGLNGAYRQVGMTNTDACAGGGPISTNMITALTATGFSLGTSLNVNQGGGSPITYVYVALYVDPAYYQVGSYAGISPQLGVPVPQTIDYDTAGFPATHLFIHGRLEEYKCPADVVASGADPSYTAELGTEFTGNFPTQKILSLQPGSFTVGTDNNVNNHNLTYTYLALAVTPAAQAKVFASGGFTAVGSDTIQSVPFVPALILTKQIALTSGGANPIHPYWRAVGAQPRSGQPATESTGWDGDGTNIVIDETAAITSMLSDGCTTGMDATPAGGNIVWFAFANATVSPFPPGPAVCPGASGVVGFPYSSFVTASGGMPPYTFQLVSGALPAGLILNPVTGQIAGTPTTAGTGSFVIQALDSTLSPSYQANVACQITIAVAAQTLNLPPGTPGGQACGNTLAPPPANS